MTGVSKTSPSPPHEEGKNHKLICIVGPTASGKSALSIKLAKKFKGEIVSADSRQIYRGMDIGTAKPPISPARRRRASAKSSVPSNDGTQIYSHGVPHHLINVRNPNQPHSLSQFKQDAIKAINSILKRGKTPFLVGGTGQYIAAIVQNWQIPEVKPNPKLRKKLERQARTKNGLTKLYKKLISLDPEAAYIVDPKNPRRIIRALEVALATGQPFTAQRGQGQPLYDCLILGLDLPKEKLKQKISKRTRQMLKAGLVPEVKSLLQANSYKLPALDAIGYREIINYLNGKIDLWEAEALINQNTWHFTRRQMNWFKKMPVMWVRNQKKTEREISKFLQHDKRELKRG